MKNRACPKQGCLEVIEHDHYACGRHWAQLPEVLKKQINQTYARHKKRLTVESERELRQAQSTATQYLNSGRPVAVPAS